MTLGPSPIVGLRGEDEVGSRGGCSIRVLDLIWCGFWLGVFESGGGCGDKSVVSGKGMTWWKRLGVGLCPVSCAMKRKTVRLKNGISQRGKCFQELTRKEILCTREEQQDNIKTF